jgi:hypothetical protein
MALVFTEIIILGVLILVSTYMHDSLLVLDSKFSYRRHNVPLAPSAVGLIFDNFQYRQFYPISSKQQYFFTIITVLLSNISVTTCFCPIAYTHETVLEFFTHCSKFSFAFFTP